MNILRPTASLSLDTVLSIVKLNRVHMVFSSEPCSLQSCTQLLTSKTKNHQNLKLNVPRV